MKSFLTKFAALITGVVSGFDRVLFRGSLLSLSHAEGFLRFLNVLGVQRVQFREFAERSTERVVAAAMGLAEERGRPSEYLQDGSLRKDERAREIARRDGITDGLICTLRSVEPCRTFRLRKNPESGMFEYVGSQRKCLFFYNYWIDPVLGFMHTRLQSWLPFPVQACINGREILARQMDDAGIQYTRRENCFTWIEDPQKAQALPNAQLRTDWTGNLNRLAALANPTLSEFLDEYRESYYWTALQSEWATDFMFKEPGTLSAIYRPIVMQAMADFSSKHVLRFLGSRANGQVTKEVTSRFTDRPEEVQVPGRATSSGAGPKRLAPLHLFRFTIASTHTGTYGGVQPFDTGQSR